MKKQLSKNRCEKIIELMVQNREFRLELVRESLYWFSHYYFPREHESAEFQREIFEILQSTENNVFVLAAGRTLGKSTIANHSYAIWGLLSKRKRFVVIVSKTQRQAESFLEDIRGEFERNERLIQDLGPFQEQRDQWGRLMLVLGNYDAKLVAASMEQPIRGMKHRGRIRPDLFILDDIEDSSSVKSADMRNKLLEGYQREIVPTGDEKTRIVILGGILHPSSFLAHMKKLIEEGTVAGIYREYPFIKDGKPIWPERYPDEKAVDALKRKIGSEVVWRQEYCLEIISTKGQVVRYEWLEEQDYDELPDKKDLHRIVIAVDPAIKDSKKSACTAIIVFSEYRFPSGESKIYVHPNPVNERGLSFQAIKSKIKELYALHAERGPVKVIVEGVQAQEWLAQDLSREGVQCEAFLLKGDKRERLVMAAARIEAKLVYFARKGNELLKQQLVGFDYEPLKDLADAFSMGVIEISYGYQFEPRVRWLGCDACEKDLPHENEQGWRPVNDWTDLFRN